MRKKILIIFILINFSLIFPYLFSKILYANPNQNTDPCGEIGIQLLNEKKKALSFSLRNLNGRQISLKDSIGKPIVLFFWTTWCPACKEDMVLLEKFSSGKKDQLNIFLLAIDGEREKKVRQIIKEKEITLPVLLILDDKILENYGIRGWIPQTVLIDRDGYLVGKIMGQRDWSSPKLWNCLRKILRLD